MTHELSESQYRSLVQKVYERIESAFEQIDPDQAECEQSQGSLTITLGGGAKWILSMQPPLRQIWLAVASLGKAAHFRYQPESSRWIDEKQPEVELFGFLEGLLREVAGVDARI